MRTNAAAMTAMIAIVASIALAACGDDGGGGNTIPLDPGTTASATIGPEGGTVALGDDAFSLEVPAGALATPTEISLTPLSLHGKLFAVRLEPSGLTFALPAIGRALVAPGGGFMPELISEDGTVAAATDVSFEGSEMSSKIRFAVPHFSTVVGWINITDVRDAFFLAPQIAPQATVTRGMPFDVPIEYQLLDNNYIAVTLREDGLEAKRVPDGAKLDVALFTVRAFPDNIDAINPGPDELPLLVKSAALTGPSTKYAPSRWVCSAAMGSFIFGSNIDIAITLKQGWTIKADFAIEVLDDALNTNQSVTLYLLQDDKASVTCTGSDVPTAMGVGGYAYFETYFENAWDGECTDLSNGAECVVAAIGEAIRLVIDPVLTLGPNAVARFTAAFPCGDGPSGKTLCAPGATFTQGDWVYLSASTLDAIKLADPVGRYQFAFVFDADGNPTNNYQPGAMFPKDFFAGTDKWYEALYDPQMGWHLSVRDVRLGSGQVASNARFIISNRELVLLVPRSELGATPGFRVTAFRHEGDYGLMGGPWSGSYYPKLGMPLFPAASNTPLVIPE